MLRQCCLRLADLFLDRWRALGSWPPLRESGVKELRGERGVGSKWYFSSYACDRCAAYVISGRSVAHCVDACCYPTRVLQMAEVAVEMFARKAKSADVTTSLQRFADLHRDCASRAKHLKLALDALCVQVSFHCATLLLVFWRNDIEL